ncbi:hypothetical protein BC938DRAFT_481892 [Jimgerdemannia flammicorona]|uniref:Ion transport domain-containing protein n=2 Tax=Jimgerdemannia flammicorona TaxID=994334 RepID=A0A433QFA0_9FUNG|nr:hypothetical protein BC938DRAFT_481892 [Jimgerdemannia flammicorona]
MAHRTQSNRHRTQPNIPDIELTTTNGPSAVPSWITDNTPAQSPVNLDSALRSGSVDTLRTTTSPHTNDIHLTVSSPDGTFLGTLSDDGVVALWPFINSSVPLKAQFAYSTPLSKQHADTMDRHRILSVSNQGRYVAVTSCARVRSYNELHQELTSPAGIENFLLIDTKTGQSIRPASLRHACGIVHFFKDDVLAICDGAYVRIYSIKHNWKMVRKLNMSVLFNFQTLLKAAEPLQQLVDMFGYERIFWFEGKNMVSMWDINSGALRSRFTLPQDYDEISFAVSPNNLLFATCTIPKPDSGETSFMTVYLTESGLPLQQVLLQDEVHDICFLEERENIISYGPNADKTSYIVHVWDAYSLRILKTYEGRLDAQRISFFPENPSILVHQNADNMLETYHAIIDTPPENLVEVMRSLDGQIVSQDKTTHIRTLANDKRYRVEFVDALGWRMVLCPWQPAEVELTAHFLDDLGNRVLIVTQYMILVFFTKNPELQYLWSIPSNIDNTITIQTVYLNFNNTEAITAYVHLTGLGDVKTVTLPAPHDRHTTAITQDLCESLAFIHTKLDRKLFQKDELVAHCKDLIKSSVPKNPSLFSRSSNGVFPLREFIYANWDDIVMDILQKKVYVPCFYGNTTESALTLAIKLRKGPIVKALVEYYSMKAEEDPNYMILVCPEPTTLYSEPSFCRFGNTALPYLRRYPDYVAMMMKKISFNLTPNSSLIQQLPTGIRPGIFERSSRPYMETYCLTAQQLSPRDKSGIQYFFDILYRTGLYFHNTWQNVFDYYTKPEGDADEFMDDAALLKTHPAKLCNVPLPGLSTYSRKETKTWWEYIWHNWIAPRSPFSTEAFWGGHEFFGEPVMEAIINFKWKRFARDRFLLYWSLQIIFFVLFAVSVTKDVNLAEGDITLLMIVIVMSCAFLLQEFRQLISFGWLYITVYNAIDLAAFILPLICGIIVWHPSFEDHNPPRPLKSAAIFILWVQFIIQMRIFKKMGIFLAIVFEIIKEILSFLILMGLIIFAFAHALFVLLREYLVEDTLPTFEGKVIPEGGGTNNTLTFQQRPEADTDLFKSFGGALKAVYFFLDRETYTIEGFQGNNTLSVFKFIFSLLTGIVLLNILIAMMAEVYGKTMADGERAWLRQIAGLIAEVEVFMMTPSDRANPDLFPSIIYYEGNPDDVEAYEEKLLEKAVTQEELRHETEVLARELMASVRSENERLAKKLEEMEFRIRGVAAEVGDTKREVEAVEGVEEEEAEGPQRSTL